MPRLVRPPTRSPLRLASLAAARWRYGPGPRLMSRLRKRWVRFCHPHVTIRFEEPVHLGPRFSLDAPRGGTLEVGAGTELRRGFRVELGGPGARVTIGRGCYFTYDTIVACSTTIEIGDRCGFGQTLFMADGNHRFRDPDVPMLQQGYTFRPLTVGDDVQVFSKCTVMADLGDRAIVAANAVVTKPVEPWTIVGGVPARAIEHYGPVSGTAEPAA